MLGSVSEIVARWLSSSGIDPARLVDTKDIEFDQLQLAKNLMKLPELLDENKSVSLLQEDTKALFSVSVELASEVYTEQTALTSTLGIFLDYYTINYNSINNKYIRSTSYR